VDGGRPAHLRGWPTGTGTRTPGGWVHSVLFLRRKTVRFRLSAWLVMFLMLAAVGTAVAQEQGGSIQGVVKDSSGAVLPGVTVEVKVAATGAVSTAITDGEGVYRFPALPPGTYEVTAALQGFSTAKTGNVKLALGQLLKLDMALSVGSLTESVQVTGEAPLIDVKQNASFSTVSQEAIERIPKGRDFTSVIATAPGAQQESKAGGEAQIDGASGSENRFIIDGMDTTNMQTGVSGKTMLVDFIQEVQVKSSGYNAEFGGATGGVISAITKSGSNSFRGSLGGYYQSDKFYGERRPFHSYNSWDANLPEQGLKSFQSPWLYLSPVADLGGPVIKDRLWFYAGMAYTVNNYSYDATLLTDPSLTKRHFEQKNKAYYPNYNLTAQLGNNLRVRFSGSHQVNSTRGALPAMYPEGRPYLGSTTGSNAYLAPLAGKSVFGYSSSTFDKLADGSINQAAYDRRWVGSGADSNNTVLSLNTDWVVAPTFFVNMTAGYYRANNTTPESGVGDSIVHSFVTYNNGDSYMQSQGYPTVPANFQQAAGFADNVSSRRYVRNIYDRIYANANATYFKSLAGQHVFKVGGRFEQFGNDIFNAPAKGVVNFVWGQPRIALDGRVVSGKYGHYYVNQTGTVGKVTSNNFSFWLQDSWSVNSKLTINAGVRAENETVPSYKKTADAIDIKFGFADKIAPRLGFAYDVKGDGKWKAYGSFGLFYDITKLELPRGAFGGDHWINYYWTLDTYDWTSINCGEGRSGCPGTFIEEWDARHSSNQPDPDLAKYFNRPGMTGIDPAMKPVQSGEMTFGVDHELTPTMSMSFRYVHKWLTRTIEDVGLILPDVGEIYIIANPGFGYTEVMNTEYPSYKTPKAQRDYDSVEARLRKRFSNRWQAELSYTWSRLYGNYGGLASSDENGRTSPNINRYYDALYMSYDKNNDPVYGLLPTDRPHVVKFQGTYDLPWGTTLGVFGIVESGLPQTSQITWLGYPVYYNGRNDLGRTPIYKNLDLNLQHDFRLGGNRRLSLAVNATNVLDLKTPIGYYTTSPWRSGVNPPDSTFYGGPWDPVAEVNKVRVTANNPNAIRNSDWYKVEDSFQSRREFRLQAKFSF